MTDRLAIFFDEAVLNHQTGAGFFEAKPSPYLPVIETHPENADRLVNMHGVLKNGPISEALDWFGAVAATREELQRFHTPEYIEELASIPSGETRAFSSTTVFGPDSYRICSMAAGLSIAAARHVFTGVGKIAYALVRPPGHHAQPDMADGYCFFNHIGVAIEVLRAQGLSRAVVIDWDVHHGNGTQEGFYADPDVLTISMHMDHGAWGKSHPQTGAIHENGIGRGFGKNLNIPMPFGAGDNAYSRVFDEIVAPAVKAHRPQLLFIACGQDASQFDPNGRQLLSMQGFYELGKRARELSDTCCDGRLVLVQEGGYAISYAAYCLHATLEGVLNRPPGLPDPLAYMSDSKIEVDSLIRALRRHPLLN